MEPGAALRAAQDLGASYADVRVQRGFDTEAELRDGRLEQLTEGRGAVAGVRVLFRGVWGFASTSRLDKRSLRAAGEQAVRAAKAASAHRGEPVKLAKVKPVKARVGLQGVRRPPSKVPLEERVALLRDLDKLPRRAGAAARTLLVEDGEDEQWLLSTEGADVRVRSASVLLAANITMEHRGRRATHRTRMGGTTGYELLTPEATRALVQESCEAALRLARAKAPKGGRMPVVVDPDLAGVFAHEAVGHACEADLVVGGDSLLAGRIGQRIGSTLVGIVDDPTLPGSFGGYAYDDEGVPARRRVLVEKGVLKGFLHSRETAAKLGHPANGAARAQGAGSRPLVRMSNTLLLGGDHAFEELLEGIREGVYAKGTRGGQVDTARGTFHFSAQEAFAIRKGEVKEALRDVSLSGSILTTLRRVDAVARDARLSQPGFCGKGQWVPVGDGGPHFRVRDCTVGGG